MYNRPWKVARAKTRINNKILSPVDTKIVIYYTFYIPSWPPI